MKKLLFIGLLAFSVGLIGCIKEQSSESKSCYLPNVGDTEKSIILKLGVADTVLKDPIYGETVMFYESYNIKVWVSKSGIVDKIFYGNGFIR